MKITLVCKYNTIFDVCKPIFYKKHSTWAENTLDNPEKVVPKEEIAQVKDGVVMYELTPRSVCVFRIKSR